MATLKHSLFVFNKREEIPKEPYTVDNPEKLAILGTQDEEEENKNTT